VTHEEWIRAHADLPIEVLVKRTGWSARRVRRVLGALGPEESRRRVPVLVVLAVLVAACGTVALTLVLREPSTPETRQRQDDRLEAEVAALESSLYAAVDAGEVPSGLDVGAQLRHSDERVRLAALRLAATSDPLDYEESVLPLLADPSPRVRRAALQLASCWPQASEPTVTIALDEEREPAERLLALGALARTHGPVSLGKRLLPLLRGEDAALRLQAASALEGMTGASLGQVPPEELHERWSAWFEEHAR
jgi:hypothetical protein